MSQTNASQDTLPRDRALTRAQGTLTDADAHALEAAVRRLHASRGVLVRSADLLAGLVGQAATMGLKRLRLSAAVSAKVQGIAESALHRAFDVAILGMPPDVKTKASQERFVAAATGAVGGFFGMAGFLPDATITTLLIMRNIAAIAVEEGADLSDEDTREACLHVFAFGGPALGRPAEYGAAAEDADTGYWSARLFLQGRPLMMLFGEVAGRYGLRIGEKFAAQAVPFVGAAGGALVNTVFLDHYRTLARVHFAIRRLERRYGEAEVRLLARNIANRLRLTRQATMDGVEGEPMGAGA